MWYNGKNNDLSLLQRGGGQDKFKEGGGGGKIVSKGDQCKG